MKQHRLFRWQITIFTTKAIGIRNENIKYQKWMHCRLFFCSLSFFYISFHLILEEKKQAKAKSIGNKASLNERYSLISQFERSDEDLLHCTRHNINYYLFVVHYVYLDWWMNECRMFLVCTWRVCVFNICFVFFSWIFSRKSDTNHKT